jgi:hypothetical protein
MTLTFVLYLLAFLCFVASACGVQTKVNLESLGLALLTLTLLI